ncbi:hypothetical protein CL628_02380 [bacterium]|nr:hypothetical protein [bacterium]
MYFWCSMFGNSEFQHKLLEYYRRSLTFDENRFQFGLFMAALEDLRLWLKHEHCSEALAHYISYLNNYQRIIES